MLKYCQKSLNSYFFRSLLSALAIIKQTNAYNAISMRIEEYLKSEVGYCIDFSNAILKNEENIGEQNMYYSLSKYKKMGYFDILMDISKPFTLVQLMEYLGDVIHAISVLGC